jgi:hypothetical protein
VFADKLILESKDLLSENRSGSPNIHGLRNPGMVSGRLQHHEPLLTNISENPQYFGIVLMLFCELEVICFEF